MSPETRGEVHSSGGGGHSRQGSGEQSNKSAEFLDQQMAKLMARKISSGSQDADTVDSGAMKRSRSGDNVAAVRNSEILDDDTRKILRDCQEYLLGASFETPGSVSVVSEESSPGARGRSAHSSPAGSYNKYAVTRSSSGNLSLSPSLTPSLRTPDRGGTRPPPAPADPDLDNSYVSDGSPQSEAGPSSLEAEAGRGHEYENVAKNVYIDGARGKLSAAASATNLRSRERRNSFRQAVDKVEAAVAGPRQYEQIWFRGGEGGDPGPAPSPHQPSPGTKAQLRKSDSGSVRSAGGSLGHVRSGSYDNIPGPGPSLNTTQAIFTLDPNPTAYEIINFSGPGRGSLAPGPGPGHSLQSVGLVAEAQRDSRERSLQPKQVLTKQNSAGNIRAPPPYQAPPGPPGPPYQSPPGPPPYKQGGGQFVTPPKHISPSYAANRYSDQGPQVTELELTE